MEGQSQEGLSLQTTQPKGGLEAHLCATNREQGEVLFGTEVLPGNRLIWANGNGWTKVGRVSLPKENDNVGIEIGVRQDNP